VVTSTVALSYLAAATRGPLRAAAVPLRVGGRQGVIEVRVHDRGDGDLLVATALLTLSFVSSGKPPRTPV
jgi:acyl-coenzyme A thioesterase PaaI-like protein